MDLRDAIGLSLLGNPFGAGRPKAPEGIVPFYVPNAASEDLATEPFSSDRILTPVGGGLLAFGPAVALHCALDWEGERVSAVHPLAFGPMNDCVLHPVAPEGPGVRNWGEDSKGVALDFEEITRFEPGGPVGRWRLAAFRWREGELSEALIDAPAHAYGCFYGELTRRLGETLGDPETITDHGTLGELLAQAGRPEHALIGCGPALPVHRNGGEPTWLETGDQALVVCYDTGEHDLERVTDLLEQEALAGTGLMILKQTVL